MLLEEAEVRVAVRRSLHSGTLGRGTSKLLNRNVNKQEAFLVCLSW